MTTEEKINKILDKLNREKPKDTWEKAQIITAIFTGVITLIITSFNIWTTYKISATTQGLTIAAQRQDSLNKENEKERQNREDYSKQIEILPQIERLLESRNPVIKEAGRQILIDIKNNKRFDNGPVGFYAKLPQDLIAKSTTNIPYRTGINNTSFWVYIGQKQGDIWLTRLFDVSDIPKPKQQIKSLNEVNKRDNRPVFDNNLQDWIIAQQIGTIPKNSIVTVIDTLTVEDNNFWAKVR